MTAVVEKAYQLALAAREHSYSPYSRFKVGAALKLRDRDLYYTGTNVENASYGGTICAERSAVVSAVASQGHVAFDLIVVVTDMTPASLPCAFCLGVLAEFCPPEFPIYLANLQGIEKQVTLRDLLPHPFLFVPPAGT